MAIKVCMIPQGNTATSAGRIPDREEVVIGSTTNNLEIAKDDGNVIVRVPYGTSNGVNSGKVLFSAPERNVFYAIHV